MKKSHLFLSLFYISTLQTSLCYSKRDYSEKQYYTLHTTSPNQIESVKQVARSLGATYEGPVGELAHYHWISIPMSSLPKRGQDYSLIERFHSQPSTIHKRIVDSIQPQTPARRLYKRAPPPYDPVIENTSEEYKLNGGPIQLPPLSQEDGYQRIKDLLDIHDPGFDNQWHLINTVDIGHDINVTGVWSQGITGKGINVAILDDGIEFEHDDLKDNYFAEGSYDFNLHVEEPKPRLEDDTHGTRCAGEIAAVKNDLCGIGVAYDAKVAGIRILSGDITEADEAAAINYAYQENHIYSCSWGPQDSGEVAQAPQGIIMDAIKNGIENGRNGTGSIFVFASGNGGGNDDNCNFDGYTNSIYTITVGAVDKLGNHPYYSEKCAAQLFVTYSSGSGGFIYTTDIGDNQCSNHHGGTSAAAPLAAGVFALVLSIRPDLTWRDMQHLSVQSAIPISVDDDDWAELPSGRRFNHKYGYGSLDAYRIVELAKTFESVRPQTNVEVLSVVDAENEKIDIPDITPASTEEPVDKSNAFKSTLEVTQDMLDERGLERLEHVTATVNIEHQRRGDMEILLESPHGVISQLGAPRKNDNSEEGLIDWTFMTVKHWEEDPIGNWTLYVIDGRNPDYTGKFMDWKLTLWGEVKEGFSLPESESKDGSNKAPDIGVDDFEGPGSERNQSFLDQNENDATTESGSSFGLYGIVSVLIIASVASTGFIVKKYMLSSTNISYTRPTEEDAFEFDNLISNEGEDLFGDSSDEGEEDTGLNRSNP